VREVIGKRLKCRIAAGKEKRCPARDKTKKKGGQNGHMQVVDRATVEREKGNSSAEKFKKKTD